MSAKSKPPEPPNLDVLSRHFTAHNFLPLAFHNTHPRILRAMEISANATADYYLHVIKKLRDELLELRKSGLKNQ